MAGRYTSRAEVRSSLGITTSDRDTHIDDLIDAVETAVDDWTGRRFDPSTSLSSRVYGSYGRTYPAPEWDGWVLMVDDIADDATRVVEVGRQGAWTVVDPAATPAVPSPSGEPVTRLVRLWQEWPTGRDRIRVTAQWGWPAVPAPVRKATLLQVARLWARRGSPEGVLGSSEWGGVRVSRVDPDVQAMLDPYRLVGL